MQAPRMLPPIAQAPPPPAAPRLAAPAPELAPPEGPPRNRVGLLLPLSGGNRQLGEQLLNAAQLALFDLGDNALELLPRDTRGDADRHPPGRAGFRRPPHPGRDERGRATRPGQPGAGAGADQ